MKNFQLVIKKITLISIMLFLIAGCYFSIKSFKQSYLPINRTIISEEMIVVDKYKTFAKVNIYNIRLRGMTTNNYIHLTIDKKIYNNLFIGNSIKIKYEYLNYKDGSSASNLININ